VEVYRTVDDSGKHKTTAHYARWREAVEELMAEPRISYKYNNIYPVDTEW
jgi:quinol monooxygenase YgiN